MNTLRPPAASQRRPVRAFSLIEVLLAIIILGIGVIGIAALFPAGIVQQQRSADDIMGPIVANNAMAILRSKLSAEDFGTYQDFDCDAGTPGHQPCWPPEFAVFRTQYGDWLWRRPGVMYADDTATPSRDERGAIDIFGGDPSYSAVSSAGDAIPYNPSKWFDPVTGSPVPPSVVFTRAERMYPNGDKVRGVGYDEQGQYYWDCMFRRFEGRILVAIFVYRVSPPPGENYLYAVPPDPDGTGIPIIPFQRSFVNVASDGPPWTPALDAASFTVTLSGGYDPYELPQTDPDLPGPEAVAAVDVLNTFAYNWQATGQWLLDENNNVHRVLAGRDRNDTEPVKLAQRIVDLPGPSFSGLSSYFYDRAPASGAVGSENIITNLWYIPTTVYVDLDGSGDAETPVRITPVFVSVEEL